MNFLIFLFLALFLVPVLEIYIFIKVGSIIHAGPVILLIIGTALLGAFLVRAQSLSTVARFRETVAKGDVPAVEMMEGIVLIVCAALLLTPGFFTDTLGFLGLIPPLRRALVLAVWEKQFAVRGGEFRADPFGGKPGADPHQPRTIEGEYRRDDQN